MDIILKIFNIGLIIYFALYLLKYLYPVLWVLLPFSFKSVISQYKYSVFFRCFLIIAIVVLASRLFIFMAGLPYQGRYFYPFLVMMTVLSGAGFNPLKNFIRNRALTFFKSTTRRKYEHYFSKSGISIFLISILFIACLGKALRPQRGKEWIKVVADIIDRNTPEGEKPIIISSLDDIRMAYYCGASFLKFVKVRNFLRSASLSGVKNKTYLTDDNFSTGTEMFGKSVIYVNLKKPYPARKAYLIFEWDSLPDGNMRIYARNGKTHIFYTGKIRYKLTLYKFKFMRDFVIEFRFEDKEKKFLRELGLYKFEKWSILRPGTDFNYGKWFFLSLPGGVKNIRSNIAKLGGKRVFLVLKGNRQQILKIFSDHNIDLPFRFLYTFKVRKKGEFTLCQGK